MKIDKIKKILIALDYGPTAQKVAEGGFSLSKNVNAEVIMLHVLSDPTYYTSMQHITVMGFAGFVDTDPMKLNNPDLLKKASLLFLDKSKKHLGDNTIQIMVEEGDIADSILKVAKDEIVDIIVMGSHGRKWLEDIVMGSVTEKIVRHTTIPVLIIPTKKNH